MLHRLCSWWKYHVLHVAIVLLLWHTLWHSEWERVRILQWTECQCLLSTAGEVESCSHWPEFVWGLGFSTCFSNRFPHHSEMLSLSHHMETQTYTWWWMHSWFSSFVCIRCCTNCMYIWYIVTRWSNSGIGASSGICAWSFSWIYLSTSWSAGSCWMMGACYIHVVTGSSMSFIEEVVRDHSQYFAFDDDSPERTLWSKYGILST